jgi:HxlR-like helix-turn-helix
MNPLDGTNYLDTVSADRTAGNLDLPRHRDTILHPCENEILDAVIQSESRFEVSLWKVASYAISTRSSFLTIRGLVNRLVHPVVPPHVDYSLTPIGAKFAEAIALLCNWAEKNKAMLKQVDRTLNRAD